MLDRYKSVHCSKVGEGWAVEDRFGSVKCEGGCEKGSKDLCVRAKNL